MATQEYRTYKELTPGVNGAMAFVGVRLDGDAEAPTVSEVYMALEELSDKVAEFGIGPIPSFPPTREAPTRETSTQDPGADA